MKTRTVFKTSEGYQILRQRYDELLASWPLLLEKLEIETTFDRVFVLGWGDSRKPPLVLLHGSMSNSAMWIGEAVSYAEHFHVYAIDIPGEPGRSEPNRLNLSGTEPERWLHEVLNGLRVDAVNLAGISLGGLFALRFAAAFPERIKRLVLLCPAGVTSQRVSFLWKAIKLVVFGSKGSEEATRLVFGNANVPEETIAYSRLISTHFTPVMSVPNISDNILARVKSPTLVITGERDVLLDSEKTIKRLKKLLPDLRSVLLPGAGHVIVDQSAMVIAFLQE